MHVTIKFVIISSTISDKKNIDKGWGVKLKNVHSTISQ